MIKFDFTDKVALVTGSSSGIGFATARGLLESGARTMLHGRRPDRLKAAMEKLGPLAEKATAFSADVRVRAGVEALFEALMERWGRIDILVNCAADHPSALVVEMAEDQWDRTIDSCLKGPFLLSQLVGRQMIAQGVRGKIVNVGSGSWKNAREGASAYCAAKALPAAIDALPIGFGPSSLTIEASSGRVSSPSSKPTTWTASSGWTRHLPHAISFHGQACVRHRIGLDRGLGRCQFAASTARMQVYCNHARQTSIG